MTRYEYDPNGTAYSDGRRDGAATERATIVAWLHKVAEGLHGAGATTLALHYARMADRIQRGEHRAGSPGLDDDMSASTAERLADIQDRLRARKFISEAMTTVMHALDALDAAPPEGEQAAPDDGWLPIETASPPCHQKCLFLCSNGEVYVGAPCYGMHPPWWCADGSALKETVVLNDTLTVTHWYPLPPSPHDGEGA